MDLAAHNYYAGGHLNRLSWMRSSPAFLRAALVSPKARFVLLRALCPLLKKSTRHNGIIPPLEQHSLAKFSWSTIAASIIPSRGQIAPSDVIGDMTVMWPQQLAERTALAQHLALTRYPTLIFLGADETNTDVTALPVKPSNGPDQALEDHTLGRPLWALDVSQLPMLADETKVSELWHKGEARSELEQTESLKFADLKTVELTASDASVAALSRSMIDWNTRNRFCGGCGRPTHSELAGWKLACTSDMTSDNQHSQDHPRPECLSKKGGVQNFCYPRSDPVCIMAITNSANDALLLGRKKGWPEGLYSCLAGFIEPGESLEDSVRREVWEEAGVRVGWVRYHSTQPWPFPGSLMIGATGEAEPNPRIRSDLDNELEDARFFSSAVILQALNSKNAISLTAEEIEQMEQANQSSTTPATTTAFKLRIPPSTAIAHQLIRSWALAQEIPSKPMITSGRRPNF